MYKIISTILLFLMVSVSSATIIQQPDFDLYGIKFSTPNTGALYIDIYNTTTIPNVLVLLKGNNVVLHYPSLFFSKYTSVDGVPYVYQLSSSELLILFKAGTLPRDEFMLMGRLSYTLTSSTGYVDLISLRDFSINTTDYFIGEIIDRINIPEPATVGILGMGLLLINTGKTKYED